MSRILAFAVALTTLGLAAPPGAQAQARPDLSGTWVLNFDKSGPEVAGNGADVPFPSQLVVTQSPTELSVKRSSVRQAPFAAVYKLDGSRVTVEAPDGITETGEARFDGATLVINVAPLVFLAGRRHGGRVPEIWTLSGNVLSVKKTMTQEGESQTATAVYEKGGVAAAR